MGSGQQGEKLGAEDRVLSTRLIAFFFCSGEATSGQITPA